jgi:hypothetical protein
MSTHLRPQGTDTFGLRNETEQTLMALCRASSVIHDHELRRRLRLHVQSAHEENINLNLSDDSSPLGTIMARANVRSKARGWL